MQIILRVVAGVVAGVLLALALVVLVELFSSVVHPLPTDFDGTKEAMCLHVERYPDWVLAVVIPMWAATAFAAVWVAQRIGKLTASCIVGMLLVAAVGFNLSMLPYPIWFSLGCIIAVPASVMAAIRWHPVSTWFWPWKSRRVSE